MKREYKLSSVVLVILIGAVVSFITSMLFEKIGGDSTVINLIGTALTSFLAFFFQYALSAGLLRNRMGSVGEYLNQINTINGRFILINIIMSLITIGFTTSIGFLGGNLVYNTMLTSEARSDNITTLVLMILLFLVSVVLSLLITYTNFYLADDNNSSKEESIGTSIKNIFKIGKDLLGKTIKIYLKYTILPLLIYGVLLILTIIFIPNDGMGGIFLSSLLTVILVVYLLFASAIVLARLSDAYIDYTEEKIAIED